MPRVLRSLYFLLLTLVVAAAPALAVPGATDRTPAASLLVPFFETGVNSATHPHDTLLVITNWRQDSRTFHYHVWDIDGHATGLNGNITLGPLGSWSAAMRDLLNTSSASVRTDLTEGAFYRGFITIDTVTAPTAVPPTDAGFPFSNANVLEGFIYYTRLSQGSANGLAMVALEALPETANTFLRGFYRGADSREEIDAIGRRCAKALSLGAADCNDPALEAPLARIHQRIFRSTPLNGSSRAVVFTWYPGIVGGPSTYCENPSAGCAIFYTYRQYDEAGTIVANGTIRLDKVVNVIENSDLVGTSAGWISIFNIPDPLRDLQVYGFSFNSANPAGNPNLTWDAIFEAYIALDDAI